MINKYSYVYAPAFRAFIFSLLILISFNLTAAENQIIASVNGEPITLNDLEFHMLLSGIDKASPRDVEKAFSGLVGNLLLKQKAEAEKLKVNEAEIQKEVTDRLETLKQIFKTQEEINFALSTIGITYPELKELLHDKTRQSMLIEKLILSRIEISDNDVIAFRKELITAGKPADLYQFQEIFLGFPVDATDEDKAKVREKAFQIRLAAAKNTPFEKLVQKYSDNKITKEEQGVTSLIDKDSLAPQIQSEIQNLKPGMISMPIEMNNGYLILKLKHHIDPRRQLIMKKARKMRKNLIETLSKEGTIQVFKLPDMQPQK